MQSRANKKIIVSVEHLSGDEIIRITQWLFDNGTIFHWYAYVSNYITIVFPDPEIETAFMLTFAPSRVVTLEQ